MLQRLSESFAEKLIRNEIISKADADVYAYGFFQTVMLLLNVITTLLLGILYQEFFLCIILNMAYIPIRISAGGHHASSPMVCYIISTLMIAGLLAIIKWVSIHWMLMLSLMLAASVIIFLLAPVETESNPLDEIERKVYRQRTHLVLSIEIIASIIFLFLGQGKIATAIGLSIVAMSITLVSGMIKMKLFNNLQN